MTPAEVEATGKQLRALASAWGNLPALVRAADALAAQAVELERMREALERIVARRQTGAWDEVEAWELQDLARQALTVKGESQ